MLTSIDPRMFRNVLGRFATGVTVVTVRAQGRAGEGRAGGADVGTRGAGLRPGTADGGSDGDRQDVHGITVNAFMSVSLDPPLVAVAIDRTARAHDALLTADRFAVSVLAFEQRLLSDQFAGRAVPRQADPFVSFDGFPVVAGALAHLVCRAHRALEAGDHTIFLGQVEALRYDGDDPLVYFGGRYRALVASEPPA